MEVREYPMLVGIGACGASGACGAACVYVCGGICCMYGVKSACGASGACSGIQSSVMGVDRCCLIPCSRS